MTVTLTSDRVFKLVQLFLLVAIAGLLLWSQPWESRSSVTRKITVNGESVVEAEPDEFVFSPYFESKGTDQEALKSELTARTNKAIDALKELGVDEGDMKLDVSSFDQWYFEADKEGVLNAYLEIKVHDKELVQKVQDYLLTTDAKGQLTPQATFSEAKKKELERQVTDQAIDNAKEKAEAQASKFDAKVGSVIEVTQSQDEVFPIYANDVSTLESADGRESASLPVLSGQNEYRQTVTVTYELQ